MDYDVCISADGRREVRIQGGVQCVMAVFGYVEHASAEVFSTMGRLITEQLKDAQFGGIIDSLE
jgi:hypothetical protein